MSAFNDKVIAEFRASNGRVDSAGFGSNLVLLHSIGAHSGDARVNPVMSLRDDSGWLVVASAKGAAADPGWAHNLRADRGIIIEAHVEGRGKSVEVTATELSGAEREAAFARFVERSPSFAAYQRRAVATRRLPVFRLAPRTGIRPDDSLPHYGVVSDNMTRSC